MLPHNSWHKETGLSLIEVLIALAIIGIALTAVIKTTTQSIRSTTYLEDKTIALWVADTVLNKIRLDLISSNEELSQEMQMLGKTWYWQANKQTTANANIEKISVTVSGSKDAQALLTLVGYRYYA